MPRHVYRTTGLASGLKPLMRHSATSPSRRATIRTDNGPRVRFSATVGEEPDVEVGLAQGPGVAEVLASAWKYGSAEVRVGGPAWTHPVPPSARALRRVPEPRTVRA